MPTFETYDGVRLSYDVRGDGVPLLVLPGGPLRPPAYLGDLGGLDASRTLVMLHHRGVGDSPRAEDRDSYRCDRMVGDVEALRRHLALEHIDLLAHSAGANLALLYAVAHPERVRRIALITPSLRAVGLVPTPEEREAAIQARSDEPWFAACYAAYRRLLVSDDAGLPGYPHDEFDVEGLFYGAWDDAAQAHVRADFGWSDEDIKAIHNGEGVFAPETTRTALAELDARVLILAGGVDASCMPAWAERLRTTFRDGVAELVVQPRAGHYPWIDDAPEFGRVVGAWLSAT